MGTDLRQSRSVWFVVMTAVLALTLHGCGTGPDLDNRGILVTLAMTAEPCSIFGPCGVRGNPFGYQFSVDGGAPHSIGADGVSSVVHAAFSNGTHEVTLVGVQAPCTDNGPQLVTFKPYVIEDLAASFIVYCPASP